MELGAFAAALVRRWYLVVVAVALAAGACVGTLSSIGPTYETRATVLLFPPSSDGRPAEERLSSNPYLELVGLNNARDILIRTLSSQSERDAFDELHPDAAYGLVNDPTTSGPVLGVEVSASSASAALDAQATLLGLIPQALADLQQGLGLAKAEFITAREITVDTRAEAVHKSQIRAAIVATVAVMALFLGLIGLVDGLLATRQARRRDEDISVEAPRSVGGPEAAGGQVHAAARTVAPVPTGEGHDGEPRIATAVTTPAGTRLTHKRARKEARRQARDDADRAARVRARPAGRDADRELDRAGA